MEYNKLKERVKKMGIRVTKNIKGKRVSLTKKELELKLSKKTVGRPSLDNQARDATKFIRVCKMVLRAAEPSVPRVRRAAPQPMRMAPPPPQPMRMAPPPPPPPLPPRAAPNARTQLMMNLKANLKRRGLSN